MTHEEKRIYLINALLTEQPRYRNIDVPADVQGQKDLLRSLMNVRMPAPFCRNADRAAADFLRSSKKTFFPSVLRKFPGNLTLRAETVQKRPSEIGRNHFRRRAHTIYRSVAFAKTPDCPIAAVRFL